MKTETIVSLISQAQNIQKTNPMESPAWLQASNDIHHLCGLMAARSECGPIVRISSHNMAGGNYWHLISHPADTTKVVVVHCECVWSQDKKDVLDYLNEVTEEIPEQDDFMELEHDGFDSSDKYVAELVGLNVVYENGTVTVSCGDTVLSFDYYSEVL